MGVVEAQTGAGLVSVEVGVGVGVGNCSGRGRRKHETDVEALQSGMHYGVDMVPRLRDRRGSTLGGGL